MKTEEKTTRKNKERIPVWLYPSTLEAIDRNIEGADCKSRSEFLDNAACYYAGYVSGKDAAEYLPPMLVSALRSTVQNTENRISSILYKLAVETSMMMRVMAIAMEISPEELSEIRGKCIQDVKKSNGALSFQNVMKEERESEK